MLAIAGIIVVTVYSFEEKVREEACGTFDNASPPVKRHKKPQFNDLAEAETASQKWGGSVFMKWGGIYYNIHVHSF